MDHPNLSMVWVLSCDPKVLKQLLCTFLVEFLSTTPRHVLEATSNGGPTDGLRSICVMTKAGKDTTLA